MKDQVQWDLQAEFPVLQERIYLNHAAVAPISARAARALCEYAENICHRSYLTPGYYRRILEVKKQCARLINARGPHEIAFVPNTSTGLSTIAKGLDWRQGDQVLITDVEYPANRYPWEDLRRFGVELREVPLHEGGRIDVEDVVEAITSRTRIVSLSHVQYATGHRIELKPVSEMVHQAGGFLCVDAIQSVGVLPVDVQAMGIDFLSADSHKWMLGPEGCGFLYCHEDLIPLLHPNVVGWMNMVNAHDYGNYQFEFQNDARRFEPGTYNMPGIAAMGASIDLLLEVGIDTIWQQVGKLLEHLCKGLVEKGYRIYSPRNDAAERSGIVIFDPPFPDTRITLSVEQIAAELDSRNIHLAVREGRLRASPHFYNNTEQIDRLIEALP